MNDSGWEVRADAIEQQLERKYYLLRCDICDVFAGVGSPEHEACIMQATEYWIRIKKARGWK